MDVTISDLGLSLLPPGVRLSGVEPEAAQLPPGAGPQGAQGAGTYFIDMLEMRASVLDLLIGAQSGRLIAEAFGGEAMAQVRQASQELTAEIRARDVALARVPGLAQSVPLPFGGKLTLSVDFKSGMDPKSQRLVVTSAAGLVDLTLEDGIIGDGKAKLTVPGDPFLSQGLTFPRVKLGKVCGRLVIAKGRATLDQVRTKSPDAEASVEGYIDLRDPLPQSELHLYLRFRPSPELVKREPTFELLVNGLAAGKRPDGFLGFSILGSLAAPVSRPSREPPAGVTARSSPLSTSAPPPSPVPKGPGAPVGGGAPPPASSATYVPPSLPSPSAEPPPPPSADHLAAPGAGAANSRTCRALEPASRVVPPPPAVGGPGERDWRPGPGGPAAPRASRRTSGTSRIAGRPFFRGLCFLS